MKNKLTFCTSLILIICLTAISSGILTSCNWDTGTSSDVTDIFNNVIDSIFIKPFETDEEPEEPEQEIPTEEPEPEEPKEPAKPLYNFGVIADPQVFSKQSLDSLDNESFKDDMYYYCYPYALELTEAVFRSAVDEYIKKDVDYVLIIGDLTDSGEWKSIDIVQACCKKLKNAGIPCYVTMGICDAKALGKYYYATNHSKFCNRWDPITFQESFEPYMAGENINWDTNSYSYSVDVPGTNTRLVSLDSATTYSPLKYGLHSISNYVDSKTGLNYYGSVTISDAQMEWLENVLKEGKDLNKDIIVTSYLPIDDKIAEYCGGCYADNFYVQDRFEELQALFIHYGVDCVFSGHMHSEYTKTITNEEGSLLEISTGSLCTYPNPLKVATLYDDGSVTCKVDRLTKINNTYLPAYITEEIAAKVTTDLPAYSLERLKQAIFVDNGKKVVGYDYDKLLPFGEKLLTKLCIYDENDENCINLINVITDWLYKIDNMPLYGENSIASVCAKYNVTLPASEYETVLDYVYAMAAAKCDGTFCCTKDSVNATIYKYIVYVGFYYLAEADLFGMLNAIDPTIKTCDLMPLVKKVFRDDVLDLTINDAVLSLFSCIAPMVKAKTGITINPTSTSGLLLGLATLLPLALPALGDEYDMENDTIWNIPYKEYIDIASGLIFADDLLTSVCADFLASATFNAI